MSILAVENYLYQGQVGLRGCGNPGPAPVPVLKGKQSLHVENFLCRYRWWTHGGSGWGGGCGCGGSFFPRMGRRIFGKHQLDEHFVLDYFNLFIIIFWLFNVKNSDSKSFFTRFIRRLRFQSGGEPNFLSPPPPLSPAPSLRPAVGGAVTLPVMST